MAEKLAQVEREITEMRAAIARQQQFAASANEEERTSAHQQLGGLQQQLADLLKKKNFLLEISLRLRNELGEEPRSSGPGSSGVGGSPLKKAKMENHTPSSLAGGAAWQKHAWDPNSSTDPSERLEYAAFFGFRPAAPLPAVIPAQLVAPELGHILKAAAQAAIPPPDLCPRRHGPLFESAKRLQALASGLYDDEEELRERFLYWHNTELGVGKMMASSLERSLGMPNAGRATHKGMLTACNKFVVSLLECKSDTGGREPLMQALCHYQQHYQDGAAWERSALHRSDPLPSLVLLLEGPRLSIHAVWTLYQNRVAYTPLTPSYYLADEPGATANLWMLVAVLGAYQRTARELAERYEALEEMDTERCERNAGLRMEACIEVVKGQRKPQPCTLPYCLLDEALGLKDIRFLGPHLLYTATQRYPGGAGERAVLIKFVEGRYGQEVHEAWHSVGAAPALYSATSVGGESMVMVVMEHLRAEEGWTALSEVAREDRKPQLEEAVREALRRAHSVKLRCGRTAAHGDMRGPNILVRTGSPPEVRIIDFDWAGPDGTALYPLMLLSSDVSWHPEVRPGAAIRQAHDQHLLDCEFVDNQ